MRKILIFSFVALFISAMMSCSSCKTKNEVVNEDTLKNVSAYVPENCISTDREYMFLTYGNCYRWFETTITLKDFLDEENDGSVETLTNVFQIIEEHDKSFDTKVVMSVYDTGGNTKKVIDGFMFGDNPLNDEEIKVNFKEAFDKLMATNLPKPHSRKVVLRKEVGPKPCNAQYIFGNTKSQVFVDAVTGNVSDKNPAYEGCGFKMPLGEWP